MAPRRSLRVYRVQHHDGHVTGILLRRWDLAFMDRPPPAAYGDSEQDVLDQLELQLLTLQMEQEELSRYLWSEAFQVRRVDVEVHPQALVKRQPVLGRKRIPLSLSYACCQMAGGHYRVMLPRFGWWLQVEDLAAAADALKNAVSAALLGEEPRWLYDFRREGEETVMEWSPRYLARSGLSEREPPADEDTDAEGGPGEDARLFPTLRAVADELVRLAGRRKLAPVVGDEPDVGAGLELTRREPLPSILLVGEPGVGKSTWVRKLARELHRRGREDGRTEPRIWQTSGERIIAGMVYLGQWQKRVFDLVEELRFEGDLLYVTRLSSILRPQPDGLCIADLLLPALQAREIALLSECDERELARVQRGNPALLERMELVRLSELPAARAAELLALYQGRVAPGLAVHPEGLRRLAAYLDIFRRDSRFPGKGFHFLDWLVRSGEAAGRSTLYPSDMSRLFSQYSGLPVDLISDDRPAGAGQLAQELARRVVGQDEACRVCGGVLARFKARLNDPDKPVGTLLFVGPTGVGKTELAKQLCRTLYGDPGRMVRLDMSEYSGPLAAERLLASEGSGTSLGERVRAQPLCLVLLDEIEKAHARVFDLLLGVLGEGRLTDALGRLVDFRMALVVMTSNLGAGGSRAAPGFGARPGATGDHLQAVRRHFRPELFNRLDHVVLFDPLGPEEIRRIVDLELAEAGRRTGLLRRRVRLRVSPAARDRLARLGFHPEHGARPLRRVIEERVITPAAVILAENPALQDLTLTVRAEDDPLADAAEGGDRSQAFSILIGAQ